MKIFVHKIIFNGKMIESYIYIRCRLSGQVAQKSTLLIPPGKDPPVQAFPRAQLQLHLWLQCGNINIEKLNLWKYSWKSVDDL